MIGFGNNVHSHQERYTVVKSLDDPRLFKVDPQETGFFDLFFKYTGPNEEIHKFVRAVRELGKKGIEAFYVPKFPPSFKGGGTYVDGPGSEYGSDGKIVIETNSFPAVGHSYNWWNVKINKELASVDGRTWKIGTEYQYYAFLVWIINYLTKNGYTLDEALYQVVVARMYGKDEVGNPMESKDICGISGLGKLVYLLTCSDIKADYCWIASGYQGYRGYYPLADLSDCGKWACEISGSHETIAWLII